MVKNQRSILILLFGLVLLSIMLLASSLPTLIFEPGEPFPLGALLGSGAPLPSPQFAPTPELDPMWQTVARIVMWVLLPLSIIYAIVSPQMRRELRRILPVMLLILALFMFLKEPNPQEREIEPEAGGSLQSAGELAVLEPPDYVTDPPAWLFAALNVIVFIVIGVAGWLFWRRIRQRMPDPQAQIILEAERALADLQSGANLRDTVMRCYAEMSHVLADARNVERHRGMTPREFETYLAALGLGDDHIRRLTRLFEGVRYGPDTPGRREELEAVDCLTAIVRAYGKAS
jgi:hypothetical protein